MKAQLDVLLQEGIEDPDPERRKVIAEALLARRLREMVHVKDEIYRDTSFITCAEYRLFLEEQRAKANDYRPDHWKEDQFPFGDANMPVLGVRPSDAKAFCSWLTEREKGVWQYRLPKEGEQKGELAIPQTGEIGFWLDGGSQFVWALPRANTSSISGQKRTCQGKPLSFDFLGILARERIGDLALDLGFARILELAHAQARVHTLNQAIDSASVCVHTRDLDRVLDLDRALVRTSALELARALAQILDHTLDLSFSLAILRKQTTSTFLKHLTESYIRTSALVVLLGDSDQLHSKRNFLSRLQHFFSRRKQSQPRQGKTSLEIALDIYETYSIVEQRMEGKVPACEGILIIKERRDTL